MSRASEPRRSTTRPRARSGRGRCARVATGRTWPPGHRATGPPGMHQGCWAGRLEDPPTKLAKAIGGEPASGHQQPWQQGSLPIDARPTLPQADIRFVGQILCRRPVVRPRQREPEDIVPVLFEGALIGGLDRCGHRDVHGHTLYTRPEAKMHGARRTADPAARRAASGRCMWWYAWARTTSTGGHREG